MNGRRHFSYNPPERQVYTFHNCTTYTFIKKEPDFGWVVTPDALITHLSESFPRNCNQNKYWTRVEIDDEGKYFGEMGEGSQVGQHVRSVLENADPPPYDDYFKGNGEMDAYLTLEYSPC